MFKIKTIFIILFVVFFCPIDAEASFIQEEQARKIVENWRVKNHSPMNSSMGQAIREIRHYQGELYGNPGYYVAFLEPNGWVIVPAYSIFEPVFAFGEDRITSEAFESSYIPYLFRIDVPMELFSDSSTQGAPKNKASVERNNRWETLLNTSPTMNALSLELNSSDNKVVVLPLLNNFWGNDTLKKFNGWNLVSDDENPPIPFYNYYTSWGGIQYPVGCSALVMAQVMRKFEYPKESTVSTEVFYDITVSGRPESRNPFGGSGENKAYLWESMDINPQYDKYINGLLSNEITPEKDIRNEIAALLHDTGLILRSRYWRNVTFAESDDITKAFMNNFGYANANLLAIENIRPSFKDIVNLNLIHGSPIIAMGHWAEKTPLDHERSAGHAFIIDGYAYEEYPPNGGKTEYHHVILGMDMFDQYFSNRIWINMAVEDTDWVPSPFGSVHFGVSADIGMIFNIFPTVEDNRKELIGGRLWVGDTPLANAEITIRKGKDNESGADVAFPATTSNAKGTFSLPVIPNMDIISIDLYSTGIYTINNSIVEYIPADKLRVGTTIDYITASNDTGFSVGNRYFGDIIVGTGNISGSEWGFQNGLSDMYNHLFFTGAPSSAGNSWNLSGLNAIFIESFPYHYFPGQPWLIALLSKIEDFVRNGGAVIISGESNPILSYLSNAAGAGVQFYAYPPFSIIYSQNGLVRMYLRGSLKEETGEDNVPIYFEPYRDGTNFPLISNHGNAKVLATAELASNVGGMPTFIRYSASLSFPLGDGMVYYNCFSIPEGLYYANRNVQNFSKWYIEKPFAHAGNMRIAKQYGISNIEIDERENISVGKAKERGLPVSLIQSQDMTVVAAIDETIMEKVYNGGMQQSYVDNASMTVSLIDPSGNVYQTLTTSGDVVGFKVSSQDNVGDEWRVYLDEAGGNHDKQFFLVMTVNGLKDVGEGVPIDAEFIPVTGVTLNSTSAELAPTSALQLTATVNPSNATSKYVMWNSSNTSVATVNSSGLVTGVNAGSATITVTTVNGGFTASCDVTINPSLPTVTSVIVTPSNVSVHKSLTQTFYATVNGTNNPPQTVTWTVEGGGAGTSITQGGALTVAAGETAASLTVRATSTADAGKSGTAMVTVTLDPNNKATINGMGIGLSGNADGAGWSWNAAANTLTLTGGNNNLA